jgi:predicted Zn-dependent protease
MMERNFMKKNHLAVTAFLFILCACATVPFTGRKQFNVVSDDEEKQLGTQAYEEVLKKTPLSKNAEWQRRVKAVGERVRLAANKPDYVWEFNVLQGKEINAFCLPGGKVAFWEGIMPLCNTDDAIAVVMGHEVAHALAHHGAERMSQGMGANIIGEILSVGLGNKDPAVRENVLKAYGLGAQVGVMLPFSRSHESEADKIGLILMAKAGYDPHAGIDFWQRMAKAGGQKPPEFLSTHPSDEHRVEQIKKWLPEALTYKP